MKAGWAIKPLKALCNDYRNDIVDGPFGANLKREHYTISGVPVLKIQNIKPFQIIEKKMDYVTHEKAEELVRHSYRKGDIIVTKLGTPLGVSAIVKTDVPGIIVADLVRVRAENIDTDFLCYQLNSPKVSDALNAQQGGATRPRVRISALRELPIAVPPLDEQRRIVAILDEAFEGLDRARENAEANLQNARELLEGALVSEFAKLSKTHGDTQLGAIADFRNGFAFKSAKFKSSGAPVVRISNIQAGEVTQEKLVYTDPKDYSEDLTRYWVKPGELLIAMSGATTGKVGFNNTGLELLQNQRVGRFCQTTELDLSFLYYFLSTKVAEHLSISAGSAQPNLSTKQIKEIRIPNASRHQQDDFVLRMGNLRQEIQSVEQHYVSQLNDLGELRQSLLQKAFAGELT